MALSKLKMKKPKVDARDAVLALDIGTEYVKALIAQVEGDELQIIGVGRKHQTLGDMHSGAIADIDGVVKNCEVALADAEEQAGFQAKNVIVGIAGELVKGTTSTIRYRRPQPDLPLSEREMEFIIEKVQDRARMKAQRQVAVETSNPEVEVKLVNSALVSIHIDGYKVSNPIGFQGKDVAVQIYTAFAPMVHIGAIERVTNELSLELIAVAAEPFAVARSVIGTDVSSNFTAILADIGGGTTDIAVIDDGGVEGTKMFGIGGRSFTHQIANELNLTYENAEKLKVNLGKGNMKPEVEARVDEALKRTLDVWMSGVELALDEFKTVDHLPSRILMCGGGASLKQITEALTQTNWYESLPFTKRPHVQLIQPSEVIGVVDKTDSEHKLDHTFITAMGLLRVGYDTISTVDTGDSIKDKLSKILRI
ncbi:MAG: pilus assembly protein PilM [Candidatus Nomurabacteria bacterium]|jgi:cell division protein FtsA|nr:pilus assembly protein PilM [Candidatus Nomurabacteria bacterium]